MPDLDLRLSGLRGEGPGGDLAAVREIAREVRAAGGRALLVGGCVRDALLGVPCHDFDLEVYGIPAPRLEKLLSARWPLDPVGASFGILKVKHRDVDVALPRRENPVGAGHRDFEVSTDPALDVRDAAARRDFTVNAILWDPLAEELVDPWNGARDLAAGVLRHVSEHFSEDPLRVLRAMQFLARFPFLSAAPETVDACSRMTQDALPRERLAAEWEKLLLKGAEPSRGLRFLRDCGWIRFYPELAALPGCPQNPRFHPEGDVWTHTLLAVDAAAALRRPDADADNLLLTLAALCHDFGKPATTAPHPDDGHVTSYNHQSVGVPLARAFVLRLWNREKLADAVASLVAAHMRPVPLVLNGDGPRAFRRLAVDVGRLDLLADLVECDIRATLAPPEGLRVVAAFRAKIAELAIERAAPAPLVMGRDLVARGLRPGPDFKPLLDECYDAQLSGAFSDAAGATAFLSALLARRSAGNAPA